MYFLFNTDNIFLFLKSCQFIQKLIYITVNAYAPIFYLSGTVCLFVIQACICSFFIFHCHLPEWILNYYWCIAAYPKLQEKHLQVFMSSKEIRISS